jgi:hypothetical protein
MSAFGNAMNAIKSVLLMQANVDRLEKVVERQSDDIAGLRDAIGIVDRRLVRLEAFHEAAATYERQARPRIQE